ncbi:MAG TPA: ABC transporter substrate-binding protein, partial [Candidatus Merdenecus merdavium]|nr:ABC transporter substrate-binding protein [Candidatus Merdenecus merdavium]
MASTLLAGCASDDDKKETTTQESSAEDKDADESKEADNDGGSEAVDDGSSQVEGAKEFLIGGMGPMTGEAASYGISVKQGAEIAIKEINEAGGIQVGDDTYVFKLTFEDDEASEDKALTAYNALMDKEIDGFLGAVTSGSSLAVIDLSSEDGILQITPSGS